MRVDVDDTIQNDCTTEDAFLFLEVDGLFFSDEDCLEKWERVGVENIASLMENIKESCLTHYFPNCFEFGVHFLSGVSSYGFKKLLALPDFVRAYTIKNEIYLLIEPSERRWEDILTHEMVHATIWNSCPNKGIVPHWMNEGMAFYLGKNRNYDKDRLMKFVREYKSDLMRDLLHNVHFPNSQIYLDMMKSLGAFFVESMRKDSINSFFTDLLKNKGFDSSFNAAFEITPTNFYQNWFESLC